MRERCTKGVQKVHESVGRLQEGCQRPEDSAFTPVHPLHLRSLFVYPSCTLLIQFVHEGCGKSAGRFLSRKSPHKKLARYPQVMISMYIYKARSTPDFTILMVFQNILHQNFYKMVLQIAEHNQFMNRQTQLLPCADKDTEAALQNLFYPFNIFACQWVNCKSFQNSSITAPVKYRSMRRPAYTVQCTLVKIS